MMKKISILLVMLLIAASFLSAIEQRESSVQPGVITMFPTINVQGAVLPADPDNWTLAERQAWVDQGSQMLDWMTSAHFRGRMAGDIGWNLAATWLAQNLSDWGVEPLAGSYFQWFPAPTTLPIGPTVITIFVDGEVWACTSRNDYVNDQFIKDFMAANGSEGGVIQGPVSWLGWGIDATVNNTFANEAFAHINPHTMYRNDFNEYTSPRWNAPFNPANPQPPDYMDELDVSGRIVIFRNATPVDNIYRDFRNPSELITTAMISADPDIARFTVGNDWIRHDEHFVKARVAAEKGAIGLLYNQMVINPNLRLPGIHMAHVGSMARHVETGLHHEVNAAYTNVGGQSRLLNDLFALQLQIEREEGTRTLHDILARAKTVRVPNADGTGDFTPIPTMNFGATGGGNHNTFDGTRFTPVNDYPRFLINATQNLFRGPRTADTASLDYDASIASHSFHFSDRIQIRMSTMVQCTRQTLVQNVVGVVRADPASPFKNEYIVWMGHADNVGINFPWTAGGAADNAGGALAIALGARYAAQKAAAGNAPARNIIFIFEGGHEGGMHGARYAARWIRDNIGAENVVAVFHTDNTFQLGPGDVTINHDFATQVWGLRDVFLGPDEHPWGVNGLQGLRIPTGTNIPGAIDVTSTRAITPGATATLRMNHGANPTGDNFVGRPRSVFAPFVENGMARAISAIPATVAPTITSIYHAPYNDRYYVGDHLIPAVAIATVHNIWRAAAFTEYPWQ